MVINHHISNVMVPIGLRAAFHGLIGLESSFEAFPENHGLLIGKEFLSRMDPVGVLILLSTSIFKTVIFG